MTPASVILTSGGNQQFSSVATDQFGNIFPTTITWTASSGTIDSSGYFTAASSSPVTVTATSGSVQGTATVVVDTHAPTVATPAAAAPNPVTATTTALSALGADAEGEANLTYTWIATTFPAGAPPTYSANDTNAAKNTTATFVKAGDYAFQVTITDAVGHSVMSSVGVTVNQTLTSIALTPASVNLAPGGTQQFLAAAKDQFGDDLFVPPALTWTATAGTIDANGFYTAPETSTTATIQASSGSVFSNPATITMVDAPPTVAIPATGDPNPLSGTTANLSVLGADEEGEAGLTYTWSATGPAGADMPTYSVNGTNAAKNATATFYAPGTYRLRATITDSGGLTTTSAFFLTVNQTLTSIVVTPAGVDLLPGGTQLFTAAAYNQFNQVVNVAFTWSATAGTITTWGQYTAPLTPNDTATITATSGSVQGTASAIIGDRPPTDILLTNAAVDENQPGAAVGTLSTADPDLESSFTYLLENDPTGKFEIAGDALKLKDGETLDFETTPSVDLLVRTTDGGGLYYEKTFTIAVTDLPEMLAVGTGDWATALTLQLGEDGKLHVYRTGTTTDAIPPHNPANVLGIEITGNGAGDTLTVVSTGTGIPTFAVNNATAILDQDNALSADTDVTVNGGVLDFNGHVSTLGNLTLTADGQVNATAIDNATTTVASGTLTAVSIVCDTLVIGSPSTAAAAAATATLETPQQAAAGAARAFDSKVSAALGQSSAAPSIPAIALTAAPQVAAPASVSGSSAISIGPITVSDDPLTVPIVSVVRRTVSAAALEPVAHLAAIGLPEPRARIADRPTAVRGVSRLAVERRALPGDIRGASRREGVPPIVVAAGTAVRLARSLFGRCRRGSAVVNLRRAGRSASLAACLAVAVAGVAAGENRRFGGVRLARLSALPQIRQARATSRR